MKSNLSTVLPFYSYYSNRPLQAINLCYSIRPGAQPHARPAAPRHSPHELPAQLPPSRPPALFGHRQQRRGFVTTVSFLNNASWLSQAQPEFCVGLDSHHKAHPEVSVTKMICMGLAAIPSSNSFLIPAQKHRAESSCLKLIQAFLLSAGHSCITIYFAEF